MTKDPFDLWHEWANKPLDSDLMIDSEIHNAVMAMPEEDRGDRGKVNAAVGEARRGIMRGPSAGAENALRSQAPSKASTA